MELLAKEANNPKFCEVVLSDTFPENPRMLVNVIEEVAVDP